MSSWRKHCMWICVRGQQDEDTSSLDYRHCSLNNVPSDVFTHERTLEELFLDSNRIRDLPRELFCCQSLHHLHLSDNELVEIPAVIGSLVNLEYLDISKNAISDLPDNIGNCKALNLLEVSVNPLKKVPEGLTKIVSLTELYLNDTFLDCLPSSFGRLNRLRVLEMRENRLQGFPSSMSSLTLLQRLDIGTNDFIQLPEVLGSLVSLRELWCDNNRLVNISKVIGSLPQLTFLDASKNCIENIAPEIENCVSLTDVHLSSNRLQHLPESIGRLSNLTTLKLNDNSLLSLPFSVGGLVSLTELDVSCNNLEELPIGIGLLRHLRTFYADDNFLVSLPAELGSCMRLTILSLRTNNLPYIPDEIGRISHLHVLNLSDNKLRNLPFGLMKLKELTALWLADNQTKPLVKLQTESDPVTGHRALTCYLLPQHTTAIIPDDDSEDEVADSFHPSAWEEERKKRRQIQFEFDELSLREQSSLQRTPTPYPKELKRRLQRRRELALSDHLTVGSGQQATDSVVRGRRSQRQNSGRASLDGTADTSRSKMSSPINPERHVLLKADREKLMKDKARMQHTSDGSSTTLKTNNGAVNRDRVAGRRDDIAASESRSLITSPPRAGNKPSRSTTTNEASTRGDQSTLETTGGAVGQDSGNATWVTAPRDVDANVSESPEKSFQSSRGVDAGSPRRAVRTRNRYGSDNQSPSRINNQNTVSGSPRRSATVLLSSPDNGNNKTAVDVRNATMDRSTSSQLRSPGRAADNGTIGRQMATNRQSRESDRGLLDVTGEGVINCSRISSNRVTSVNRDDDGVVDAIGSTSFTGQTQTRTRERQRSRNNDGSDHLDAVNNNTERKSLLTSPNAANRSISSLPPQTTTVDSNIPDGGIEVMPYAEFVKTLTTRGVAPPRGVVIRREGGSAPVPRYVVQHHRQHRAHVRSLRRHGYDSEDGYVAGRRHGYESDRTHESGRRRAGAHGYESDVGYRSDVVTGSYGDRVAAQRHLWPNSSVCSAGSQPADLHRGSRGVVYHSDQDVRAPRAAPQTAQQFVATRNQAVFDRSVREPIKEEELGIDGTWMKENAASRGQQQHRGWPLVPDGRRPNTFAEYSQYSTVEAGIVYPLREANDNGRRVASQRRRNFEPIQL